MYEFIRVISHADPTISKNAYLYRNTKNNKLYLSYEKPYITSDLISKFYENIGINCELSPHDIENGKINCFDSVFIL